MLTIHLLTQNDDKTLDKCLKSIVDLDASILVGDFSSHDNSVKICKSYGAKVVNFDRHNDLGKCRNNLVNFSETNWQFYIEPWEFMMSGHDALLWAITQDKEAYNIYSVEDNMMTKELRLWKKSSGRKFVNPVYETIEPNHDAVNLDCFIRSESGFKDESKILREWKMEEPKSAALNYYLSCNYLKNKKYDEFLSSAKHYLFYDIEPSISVVMTNYYCALVFLLIKKDYGQSMSHIVKCLCYLPTMAEFWCVLGDIFLKMKQYNRAIAFYENAELFGSRRTKDDPYPIDISKYKEYPQNMKKVCNGLSNV